MITVGPEDLFNALSWLHARGDEAALGESLEAFRGLVDQPLGTLLLAEDLGLLSTYGGRLELSIEGQAWLDQPSSPPPAVTAVLKRLPINALWPLLNHKTLPLAKLLDVCGGDSPEESARALADWGAFFGLWRIEDDQIHPFLEEERA